MYNSIMQPFHGQRAPSVLIQIPPKGQARTKRPAGLDVFILLNCLFFFLWAKKENVSFFFSKEEKAKATKDNESVAVAEYLRARK